MLCGKGKGVNCALHPLVNVARSLGDMWSYKEEHTSYLVSPVPDVRKEV